MNTFYYILLPIIGLALDLILGILAPLITLPVSFILSKIENNPSVYRLRPDMIIQGFIRGVALIYLLKMAMDFVDADINFWWIITTIILLSILKLASWKNENPTWYEFSLNVSPVIGYALGIYIIL